MRVAFALAALLLPLPVAAQDIDYAARQDTFMLFTDCAKLDLLVTVQDDDNDIPELTELSVERAVRSRLRAAQLYDEYSFTYLSVGVMIIGRAFSIDVELRRRVAVGEVVEMALRVSPNQRRAYRDRVAVAIAAADSAETYAAEAEAIGHVMLTGVATTWDRGSTGTSGNAAFVRDGVAQHLDEFIDEYLRVNGGACPYPPCPDGKIFRRLRNERCIVRDNERRYAAAVRTPRRPERRTVNERPAFGTRRKIHRQPQPVIQRGPRVGVGRSTGQPAAPERREHDRPSGASILGAGSARGLPRPTRSPPETVSAAVPAPSR